jgi:hypothetical protein
MKKLFTLLAATFCATAIFAQYDNHGNDQRRDEVYQSHDYRNGRDFNDNYSNYSGRNLRKINRQVERINREFDVKISRVRSNWSIRPFEKERIIVNLEQERRQEIRSVYARFGGRDRDFDRNRF